MAEQEVVAAKPREGKFNKNAARRVRVAGMIPGVVYGAKEPSIAVELDPKQITRILHSDSGTTRFSIWRSAPARPRP